MQPTPLFEASKRLGAVYKEVAGWSVAQSYGNTEKEYWATQNHVSIADRSHLGRILAHGSDTLDLLNRLSTNIVDPMPVGTGESTVITTGKGRILDWITMLHYSDDVLMITSPERTATVSDWIATYTFDEDTTLSDVTRTTGMLSLLGPSAEGILPSMLGDPSSMMSRFECCSVDWNGYQIIVARTNPVGQYGFDIIVPKLAAEAFWETAIKLGIPPVGQDALEDLRIEAKLPKWGHELTEEHNPLEAGLEGEIAWDKGCYTGQEVVARLFNYHRIQRRLVKLELPFNKPYQINTPLVIDGQTVGYLTSVSTLPKSGTVTALASLRSAYVELDRTMTVGEAIGTIARVIAVPVV